MFAVERFAPEQGLLHPLAVADIANIALDHLLGARQVHVAHEFHRDQVTVLCLEWKILEADVFPLLQGKKSILAGLDIGRKAPTSQSFLDRNSSA